MKTEINREKLFRMVSVGVVDEPINQAYDIISTGALLLNLAASIMLTFDKLEAGFGPILVAIEAVTVLFFGVDYVLRLITANYLFPESNERDSLFRYVFSFSGIIDLLSFLPYYLPVFFPAGIAAFRMFRVVRIFRLFRINAYYDSLNVITEVIFGHLVVRFDSADCRLWRYLPGDDHGQGVQYHYYFSGCRHGRHSHRYYFRRIC